MRFPQSYSSGVSLPVSVRLDSSRQRRAGTSCLDNWVTARKRKRQSLDQNRLGRLNFGYRIGFSRTAPLNSSYSPGLALHPLSCSYSVPVRSLSMDPDCLFSIMVTFFQLHFSAQHIEQSASQSLSRPDPATSRGNTARAPSLPGASRDTRCS